MDIWIIRDGEKAGPIPDYEIRGKIEAGDLPASTPAWHDGMSGWRPLEEIELFRKEFVNAPPPPPTEPAGVDPYTTPAADPAPPPLPAATHFGRRFWARWFDMYLYTALWWFAMWASRQNIEAAMLNPWIMFFHYVPWFIFEAMLLHYSATTPGKWLLGLRVVNKDDSKLTLHESTRRSTRVLLTGVGFGWGILALFCQALSLFIARKLGAALWDHAGGHRVETAPLHPARLVGFIIIGFAALTLQFLVVSPYLWKYAAQENPEAAKFFESYTPWHLPDRE